jgi:sulfur carrier protein ThiS
MGNSASINSIISPQKFQEQVFSIVLYHICPKANPGMKFVASWNYDKLNDNSLPIPEDITYQMLLDFYSINDDKVSNYLNKQILNTEENLTRFYRILIAHLNYYENLTKEDTRTYSTDANDKLTRSKLDLISSNNPTIQRPLRITDSKKTIERKLPVENKAIENERKEQTIENKERAKESERASRARSIKQESEKARKEVSIKQESNRSQQIGASSRTSSKSRQSTDFTKCKVDERTILDNNMDDNMEVGEIIDNINIRTNNDNTTLDDKHIVEENIIDNISESKEKEEEQEQEEEPEQEEEQEKEPEEIKKIEVRKIYDKRLKKEKEIERNKKRDNKNRDDNSNEDEDTYKYKKRFGNECIIKE